MVAEGQEIKPGGGLCSLDGETCMTELPMNRPFDELQKAESRTPSRMAGSGKGFRLTEGLGPRQPAAQPSPPAVRPVENRSLRAVWSN